MREPFRSKALELREAGRRQREAIAAAAPADVEQEGELQQEADSELQTTKS